MSSVIRFDCFELDLSAGLLYKRGTRLPLRDQSARVLAALVEHPGKVVTREDLRKRLWDDDVFIDFDNSLNTAVARLREALNDSADHPRFIETLPKHGYRFIAPVTRVADAPRAATRARLLVLPFVNLTGDWTQGHLADALTDDVITELAAPPSDALAVIARTTAMFYKGSRKDVGRIGRELRVDFVVEGAVLRTADALSVNVQLVRVADQTHIWAKRYEATPGEVFGISGSAARAIAAAVDVRAVAQEDGATPARTYDPVAYNEYFQGLYCLDHLDIFGPDVRAKAHFEKALATAPRFALAHDGLAELYWMQGYLGALPPREAFAAGILHAVQALEIDNRRPETRALVAQFYKQLDYTWPEIHRQMAAALEMRTTSSRIKLMHSVGWLMPQGRIDEAIAELEPALDWDPLSYALHLWVGILAVLARDWDRGIAEARVLTEQEPGIAFGPWLSGIALRGQGRRDESIAAARRSVELSRGEPMMLGWLGLVLGASGQPEEARAVLERLHDLRRNRYVAPSSLAWTHLGLGELDLAFEWMDRAIDARDQLMMPIKSYAFLDPIRNDGRFAALLRKMNL